MLVRLFLALAKLSGYKEPDIERVERLERQLAEERINKLKLELRKRKQCNED